MMRIVANASNILMFLGAIVTLTPNMFNVPNIRNRAEHAIRAGQAKTIIFAPTQGLSDASSPFILNFASDLRVLIVDVVLIFVFLVVVILLVALMGVGGGIAFEAMGLIRNLLLLVLIALLPAALTAVAMLWAATTGRFLRVLIWLHADHVRKLTWLGVAIISVGFMLSLKYGFNSRRRQDRGQGRHAHYQHDSCSGLLLMC